MKKIFFIFSALLLISISPTQIVGQTVQQELQRRGLTLQQAQQLARQAGVNPDNPTELAAFARANGVSEAQIQEYLAQLGVEESSEEAGVVDITGAAVTSDQLMEEVGSSSPETTAQMQGGLPYFGYEIFSDIPDPFLPSAVGPVDEGYVIGPDDELRLTIWGATELQYDLAVDAEGRTFIPTIGLTTVAGESLKDLRESLKRTLSRSYSGLTRDPQTVFMDLTVTRFKPIELFVLGEVENPGGYTFTSNSTLFNVLYGVGGPKVSGSLRDIRIIRNGQVVANVDLYKMLLKGIDPSTIPLLNNDRIFVPPRMSEISIRGPIFREGIYELKRGEELTDLIEFAGGLESEAYGGRFQISRIIPLEQRLDPTYARQFLDFNLSEVMQGNEDVKLEDDDRITIFNISDVSDDYVRIIGGVNQPGTYQLDGSIANVRDLIIAADSLQDDAFSGIATIIRINSDSTRFTFDFDLLQAIDNNPEHNLRLQQRDVIQIFENRVREPEMGQVIISGDVKNPGEFRYSEGLDLEQLLLKAGGFKQSSYVGEIEITRTALIESDVEKVITIRVPLIPEGENPDRFYSTNDFDILMERASDVELQINDRIFVRSNPAFESQEIVTISGEVEFPGAYTIIYENELLSEVIKRAGGITSEAYPMGARLKRDSLDVVIELDRILNNDLSADILLQKGDEVFIPKKPNTVLVTGNVALDGYFKYKPGEKFTYYFDQAGGMQPNTFKYLLLTQANGATYRIKRKGMFKDNPVIEDGAVIRAIFEPEKPSGEKITFREVLGETTAILTSALTIYLLVDRL